MLHQKRHEERNYHAENNANRAADGCQRADFQQKLLHHVRVGRADGFAQTDFAGSLDD